ncbi:hypothetical protein K3G39_19050 [Pontibacter sp. HSC-14F20]|uniref:hypothetical protein n=1 Tax=Pontibacter sp. HSC-14F20 TaxID=2864136 RepID=UPI001C7369C6|nr:hypothetical protein [Pontibacter sp. HSC-14F20]MBX0335338.1 hypothetical protein [Pontibacter sp. HSC-14F20]
MKKSKKVKDRKTIEELKRLRLFGDAEGQEQNDDTDLDNLAGGNAGTTVETHWPTTTNKFPNQ